MIIVKSTRNRTCLAVSGKFKPVWVNLLGAGSSQQRVLLLALCFCHNFYLKSASQFSQIALETNLSCRHFSKG